MAQAPQDPYQGVQGVRTAWATLARWVSDTLPSQWLQLQEIIDYVGGAGAPGPLPGPTGPRLGGASAWPAGEYLDYEKYGLNTGVISGRFQLWNFNEGQEIRTVIGQAGSWDGHPDADTISATIGNRDIMISATDVSVWPGGTGYTNVPDGVRWEPGREVLW